MRTVGRRGLEEEPLASQHPDPGPPTIKPSYRVWQRRARLVGGWGLAFALATIFAILEAAAEPNKEQYELQEHCGQGAAKRFKNEWGNGINTTGDSQNIVTYRNHYNPALNKCFYLEIVNNIPTAILKNRSSTFSMVLLDLNENKEWGHFFQSEGDSEPLFCYVGQKRCHSQDEWMELVKYFIGD